MAVRRLTPLGQRLIAAGAQPERAQQFVDRVQFDKGPQLTTFKGAGMPKKLGDPFDDQSRAASEDYFKDVFRPPTDATSPIFKQYVDVVLGKGAYDSLTAKASKGIAPTYGRASTASTDTFDRRIADAIKGGTLTPEQIVDSIIAYQASTDPALAKVKASIGGRTRSDISSYVNKMFTEFNQLQGIDVTEEVLKQLNKDKAYQYGLPDSKLRYGTATDLSKGTVSILTNPAVNIAYKKFVAGLSGDPQAERKVAGWVANAVTQANRQQRTPYRDEIARRERFRGKQVGG